MEPIYNIKPSFNIGINTLLSPARGVSQQFVIPNTGILQTNTGVSFTGSSPLSLNSAQIKALAENNPRIIQLMDEMNVWKYS